MDIQEIFATVISATGILGALVGFLFWKLQRKIERREQARDKVAEERERKAEERAKAREELDRHLVQMSLANNALCVATARAVQRIPDAKCNGDMTAALDFASKTKQEEKAFLTKQGIHALYDE